MTEPNLSCSPIQHNSKKDEYQNWFHFHHKAKTHDGLKQTSRGGVKLDSLTTDRNEHGSTCGSVQQWTVILKSKTKQTNLPHIFNSVNDAFPDAVEKYDESNSGILNSVMLCQTASRELDLIRQQKNGISYITEFICKLQKALDKENKFFNVNDEEVPSISTSSLQGNSDISDSATERAELPARKLPKLGKVYAELRTCMKTSDEICTQWMHAKGQLSATAAQKIIVLKETCQELQGKMLLHVRWLIEARLYNISHLVSLHYNKEGFTLDEIFGSNENKRFCKLFEVYNEHATRFLKNSPSDDIFMHCFTGKQFMNNTSPIAMSNNQDTYGSGISHKWNNLQSNVVYPMSVRYILDILSSEFLRMAGHQVSFIFRSCQDSKLVIESKHSRSADSVIWADASRIEVRPVHPPKPLNKSSFFRVIKRVAGVKVPDLNMDQASRECHLLSVRFAVQEKIISNFITGLNGKTKLLRRSYNFQDSYLSDDTMSVASSENMSTSSYAHHSEVTKSVTWHDSWNNDAVRSLSAHYREFLTNAVPFAYLSSIAKLQQQSTGSNDNCTIPYNSSFQEDLSNILMQAVISNLGHLNVMGNDIHKALQSASTGILISSALARSDALLCAMLGRTTPGCERISMQLKPDNQLTVVSGLCISSLHPLLHVMEMYPSSDALSRDVLPRIEAILTSMFWWIQKKIQEFFASWSLPSLLQICLSDLREITNASLDCLRLVESCHNHIESKRNTNSASLLVATQYLHSIDTIITNMQVTSGTCMKNFNSELHAFAYKIISKSFPPQKSWIQRNSINVEEENKYIQELIDTLIKNACTAVVQMDAQFQIAAMTPVVNAVYESCLAYIAKTRLKFSMQGAMQLSYDFSAMINYVTSDISGLSHDVQVSLSSLHSVKRSLHVAQLLQSSYDYSNDDEVTDERFRPQNNVQSSMSTIAEEEENVNSGELGDRFWLSLRKQNVRRSRTWSSFLPCIEQKT